MNTHFLTTACISALTMSVSAVTISLDYTNVAFFDTSTTDGQKARAAVDAAASDLSAAITTSMAAFNDYNHTGTGPSGSSANFDGVLNYTHPDTGASTPFTGSLAADEFKIFVGARALGGDTLGQGGPGSSGFSAGGSVVNNADFQTAVDNASASFTAEYSRGSNVVTSSFSGTIGTANYSLTLGPTIGNLWFDNDGSSDFHLDHTTAVVAGKSDLYSVALHEILHAVGIGTYTTWDNQISGGTNWTGAEAIASHGTGNNLIDAGGGHIAQNIMSARLSDGVMQEVIMDPNITTGTRKELTQLDLAFLRDLGYTTVPVPEPSSTLLLGLGSYALIMRRRK